MGFNHATQGSNSRPPDQRERNEPVRLHLRACNREGRAELDLAFRGSGSHGGRPAGEHGPVDWGRTRTPERAREMRVAAGIQFPATRGAGSQR
jgi:hypothetical protein